MERWALTKMWGMAHNKGWADEPVEYINAITALENEQNKMEYEEMERRRSEQEAKAKIESAKKSKK